MSYDSYVTSPSVLDWVTGAKFLEVIATPGVALTAEPIPRGSIPPIPRPLEDREKPR